MAVWLEVERKLAAMPSSHPAKQRFLERVNTFGQVATMDRQGRLVLPQLLREVAGMTGEVSVLGLQNHLAIWNQKRLLDRFKKEPFSEDDGRALAEHGI
jgi:MraZ protein